MPAGGRDLARRIATAVAVLAAIAPASASAATLSVDLRMPDTVTVGQAKVRAHVVLTSSGENPTPICEDGGCSSSSFLLVPSCGSMASSATCDAPDPGVFAFADTAAITPGTHCGSSAPTPAFGVSVADPVEGILRVATSNGAMITLGPAGSGNESCDIALTFDVTRSPAIDAVPATAGSQTLGLAVVHGFHGATEETATAMHVTTVLSDAQTMPPCTDCDNDGYPSGVDCDDANAAVNPGETDIPGNAADEDCEGGPAPYPRLDSSILYEFHVSRARTVFTDLYVRAARAGSTIRVSCRGRGCRFKVKTRHVRTSVRRLSLTALVRRSKLRAGARLEVRVTKPNTIGILRLLTVRAARRPTQADYCLVPGARHATPCPL